MGCVVSRVALAIVVYLGRLGAIHAREFVPIPHDFSRPYIVLYPLNECVLSRVVAIALY